MSTVIDQPSHETVKQGDLQRRKQEFVRNAIWDAAIEIFQDKGFDLTTVGEIAERAGTSRRSFFRHFESKSDLMGQPVVEWGDALIAAITASPATLAPSALLREVVFRVSQQSAASERSRRLMEIAAAYPAAREAQLSRVAGVQDRVAAALAERIADRGMVHLLAGLILVVLGATHQLWYETGETEIAGPAQRTLDALSAVVCGGSLPTQGVPMDRGGQGARAGRSRSDEGGSSRTKRA